MDKELVLKKFPEYDGSIPVKPKTKKADRKNEIDNSNELGFTTLMATFRNGKKEPFNKWFPYLEGFSTDFVKTILNKYFKDPRLILDPFGGTVTTGFACSEMNIGSYYCEVNPIMQFIAETKIQVRLLNNEKRRKLKNEMDKLNTTLEREICSSDKDPYLDLNYKKVFEDSKYFPKHNYALILQTKTFINKLKQSNEILANIVTVASFASLILSSNMKRSGDVRFKNKKERGQEIPNFVVSLQSNLANISNDLLLENAYINCKPILIIENAKNLHKLPHQYIDGVITSPPYINGTNYFRNTKLELWFLGVLSNKNILKNLRKNALTSGINTVSGKYRAPNIRSIEKIISELETVQYDSRLSRLVAGYFSELYEIFEAIYYHLKEDGLVAIDIGDSKYAGVHIPCDELLIEVMEKIGYKLDTSVLLRTRHSNDGSKLKQMLLLFRKQEQHEISTLAQSME